MADVIAPSTEDRESVGSRVSWGAIFAGAVVALAAFLVLTLLGGAIGLSVSGDVRADNLKTGGALWAIMATTVALFLGGWVTTQLAVGESRAEAVVHGVLVWGLVFAMMLMLMATGIRAGFNAMVGIANVGQTAARDLTPDEAEAAARRIGVPSETVAEWRKKAGDPAEVKRAAEEAANKAADAATTATWWTLLGTLASMAAAVAGALAGAGVTYRVLARVQPRHATARDAREAAFRG